MKIRLFPLLNGIFLLTLAPHLIHAEEEKPKNNWLDKTLERTNGVLETYQSGDGKNLQIYVLKGEPDPTGKKKPVLILYHGGGWGAGGPTAMVLPGAGVVSEGFVAVAPQTRLFVKGKPEEVTLHDVMEDAYRAAVWVVDNADRLGIDPERLYLAGTSAGGHLASSVALIGNPKDKTQTPIPCRGLVLFNPVVDTGPEGYGYKAASRVGDYKLSSPVEHVAANSPPTLIFHGTADKIVKIENARKFRDKMVSLGVACELIEYEGEPHGLVSKMMGKMKPDMLRFLKKRESVP